MVPVGRLAVLKNTPKEQLITAVATLTWPALVAPIIGPPLGGLITTWFSWRWIFFLNLPIGIIAVVLARRLMIVQAEPEKGPLISQDLFFQPCRWSRLFAVWKWPHHRCRGIFPRAYCY